MDIQNNASANIGEARQACGRCGAPLTSECNFCPGCGSPVVPAPATGGPAPDGSGRGDTRAKAIIGISICVIAVCAILIGVMLWQSNRAEHDRAHAPVAVRVAFDLPGYGDGAGTGVPVRIEGEDLDGNAVSAIEVLPASGGSVELLRGEYTVQAAGSPVSAAGVLYACPTDRISLSVGEEGAVVGGHKAAPGVDSSTMRMSFTSVAPRDVTDEQIAGVCAWMQEAGCAAADVDAAAHAATSARQAELDRIAEEKRLAEEEARRQAEEEARRRAEEEARRWHVVTDDFEFDIPEYWRGRVDWEVTTNRHGFSEVVVYLKGHPEVSPSTGLKKCRLVTVAREPNEPGYTDIGGDVGNHMAYSLTENGKFVSVWAYNWPFFSWLETSGNAVSDSHSESQLRDLVDLSTGGSMPFEQSIASESSGYRAEYDFTRSAFSATLSIR